MIAYWCIRSILYRLVSVHFGTNIQHLKPISFNICIYLQQVVTTYTWHFCFWFSSQTQTRGCINQHNVSHCAWGVLQVPVTCPCTAITCFGIAMCVHSLFAFSCLLPLPEVLIDAHNIWSAPNDLQNCNTQSTKLLLQEFESEWAAGSTDLVLLCYTVSFPKVNGRQEAPTLCFCATLCPVLQEFESEWAAGSTDLVLLCYTVSFPKVNGRQEAPTLCFCATLCLSKGGRPWDAPEAVRQKSESESEQLANLLAHLFAWRCNSWMLEATCTASNGSNQSLNFLEGLGAGLLPKTMQDR